MQGWRGEMQDAHMCKLRMGNYFFGVFDGHGRGWDNGGSKMAQESSTKLLNHIGELTEEDERFHIEQKMRDGFLKLDDELRSVKETERSGTTAVVCCILANKIVFSNCGDSRGILCRDGRVNFTRKITSLSQEHWGILTTRLQGSSIRLNRCVPLSLKRKLLKENQKTSLCF